VLPSFDPSLQIEDLMPGRAESFALPSIIDGTKELASITVEGTSILNAYLTVNYNARTIAYDGLHNTALLDALDTTVTVKIRLTNTIDLYEASDFDQ
jgi:hypothetical protein